MYRPVKLTNVRGFSILAKFLQLKQLNMLLTLQIMHTIFFFMFVAQRNILISLRLFS